MKTSLFPLLIGLSCGPLLADEVVTLGDSLTFAYEAEFCFRVNILLQPYGDGMPAHVRNWIEVLGAPAYRGAFFNQGARKSLAFSFPLSAPRNLFFRQDYNWAIPGLKIDQLRRLVMGEATFLSLLAESEDFETLSTAFEYSNFNEDTDFNIGDMHAQIGTTAERVVLFIGGNDVRDVYGTIYNGGSAGTFVDDFIADANAILDQVRVLNPNIQIVVVAVPHIGITPDIKAYFPTDPVKTPLVTAILNDLNSRLKTSAEEHSAGFADIFTPTLSLLQPAPYCIHGITFTNAGSATGDLNSVWLNGPISANFHPNTNAQLVIANTIIAAFNERYQTGIAPLSATEMLGNILGKTATQIDMPFATWMSGFGIAGSDETSDADGDGIAAGVEFALGLNPTLRDAGQVTSAVVPVSGGKALEIVFPKRLPTSARYTLQAMTSPDLTTSFIPVTPVTGNDGLLRARTPAGTKGFLRLESTITP